MPTTSHPSLRPRVSITASISSNTQLVASITQDLLTKYFPEMRGLENILWVCMSTFAHDTNPGFNVHRGSTTRGYTSSENKSSVSKSYKKSQNYINFNNATSLSPDQREGVIDGFYGHGISQAMGYYFIRGTVGNTNLRSWFGGIMDTIIAAGIPLEINIGDYMSTIMPDNGPASITTSVAQGLIVLNSHIRIGKRMYPTNSLLAMGVAVGGYLGWSKDNNGSTGTGRVKAVANLLDPSNKLLIANGINPTNSSQLAALGQQIFKVGKAVSPKSGSSTTQVASSSPSSPVSDSTANCCG